MYAVVTTELQVQELLYLEYLMYVVISHDSENGNTDYEEPNHIPRVSQMEYDIQTKYCNDEVVKDVCNAQTLVKIEVVTDTSISEAFEVFFFHNRGLYV